jgi:hypothetical protein
LRLTGSGLDLRGKEGGRAPAQSATCGGAQLPWCCAHSRARASPRSTSRPPALSATVSKVVFRPGRAYRRGPIQDSALGDSPSLQQRADAAQIQEQPQKERSHEPRGIFSKGLAEEWRSGCADGDRPREARAHRHCHGSCASARLAKRGKSSNTVSSCRFAG